MGIFKAFGFGILLLILATMMPPVLSELSKAIVVFLQSSEQAFLAAGTLASYAGHIPPTY